MLRYPEFGMLSGKGMSGLPRGGDVGRKDIEGRETRGQGGSGSQGGRAHCVQQVVL